jgi:hypothetical protein
MKTKEENPQKTNTKYQLIFTHNFLLSIRRGFFFGGLHERNTAHGARPQF